MIATKLISEIVDSLPSSWRDDPERSTTWFEVDTNAISPRERNAA